MFCLPQINVHIRLAIYVVSSWAFKTKKIIQREGGEKDIAAVRPAHSTELKEKKDIHQPWVFAEK